MGVGYSGPKLFYQMKAGIELLAAYYQLLKKYYNDNCYF